MQIRQFARLRSTTCSLQGLSPMQRSARATPSRDLTLGVKAREPRPTISPKIPRVQIRKDSRRGTQVAVLPRMERVINPGVLSSLALPPASGWPAAPRNVVAVRSLGGYGCSGHPSCRCVPLCCMDVRATVFEGHQTHKPRSSKNPSEARGLGSILGNQEITISSFTQLNIPS